VDRSRRRNGRKKDGARRPSGDPRLPVTITTRFLSGGATHSDTAIYDVGYRLDEGLLDSDVDLLGLSPSLSGSARRMPPHAGRDLAAALPLSVSRRSLRA
jgi:hypothetical protein